MTKIKTIAELRGLDIPKFRKEMVKMLDDLGIKKRPLKSLSDVQWTKEFEIMTAGNLTRWKQAYQMALEMTMEEASGYNLH